MARKKKPEEQQQPTVSGGSTVFNDAGDGRRFGYIQWFGANANMSLTLDSTERSMLFNSIGANWFAVGFKIWENYDPQDRRISGNVGARIGHR